MKGAVSHRAMLLFDSQDSIRHNNRYICSRSHQTKTWAYQKRFHLWPSAGHTQHDATVATPVRRDASQTPTKGQTSKNKAFATHQGKPCINPYPSILPTSMGPPFTLPSPPPPHLVSSPPHPSPTPSPPPTPDPAPRRGYGCTTGHQSSRPPARRPRRRTRGAGRGARRGR